MRPKPHQTCKSAYSTNPTTAATDTRSTNSTRLPYNLRDHPIIIANLASLRKPFEKALENIANIANIADIANVIAAYSDKSQTLYTLIGQQIPLFPTPFDHLRSISTLFQILTPLVHISVIFPIPFLSPFCHPRDAHGSSVSEFLFVYKPVPS